MLPMKVVFKNCAPFSNCKSRTSNTQVEDAHDINLVMLIYNLLEYSDNYSKTFGVLWQYCRNELAVDGNGEIADFTAVDSLTNSFKIKEKITGQTSNNGRKAIEIMVPLNLNNFWRTLQMRFI